MRKESCLKTVYTFDYTVNPKIENFACWQHENGFSSAGHSMWAHSPHTHTHTLYMYVKSLLYICYTTDNMYKLMTW